MTVYTGRTFQTWALRVWSVWVSMRDFSRGDGETQPGRTAVVAAQMDGNTKKQKEGPTPLARGAVKWR